MTEIQRMPHTGYCQKCESGPNDHCTSASLRLLLERVQQSMDRLHKSSKMILAANQALSLQIKENQCNIVQLRADYEILQSEIKAQLEVHEQETAQFQDKIVKLQSEQNSQLATLQSVATRRQEKEAEFFSLSLVRDRPLFLLY